MALYQTLERHDKDNKPLGIWHYTCTNGSGTYPTQGCTNECKHKTSDEAYLHHKEWLKALYMDAVVYEIDTKYGKKCEVKDCEGKAFWERIMPGYVMGMLCRYCDDHKDDPPVESFGY